MKTCRSLITDYLTFLETGFSCRKEEPYLVLETPFQYVDGDYIDLYIEQVVDLIRVSDLGETSRKLSDMGINLKNKGTKSLINKIVNNNGVSSTQGILYFMLPEKQSINQNIYFLIQAIQQVDGLVFSQKQIIFDDFAVEVDEFLGKKGFNTIKNHPISGNSTTEYRIPIFINHTANIMIKPLSSPTKGGEFDQIARISTAFQDIKRKFPNYKRAIIINDRESSWEQKNISLAEDAVDIPLGYWSKRDDFSENIKHVLTL